MTIPATFFVDAPTGWRLIAWSRPSARPVHLWLIGWSVDREVDDDGAIRAVITPRWSGRNDDAPPQLFYVLTPRRIIAPTEPSPTIGGLAEEFETPADASVPYVFGDGDTVRDVVGRAVHGGDDRLAHLLSLAERQEVAWTLERLLELRNATPRTPGAYVPADDAKAAKAAPKRKLKAKPEPAPHPGPHPCGCGLEFSDPWVAATHRGHVHQQANPRCAVCGLSSCDSVLGRSIHAALIPKEEITCGQP